MTHGVQQVLVSPRLSHIWCCQAFYTCQSNWYGLLLCCSALIIHHAKHYYIYVFTFLLHSFREGRRMYVLLWVCACHSTGVEDRRQPGESVLPFCCVGPRDWTQGIRLGDMHLHPMSHLSIPCTFLFLICDPLSLKCLHLLCQVSVG